MPTIDERRHRHHIVPRHMGGSDASENIVSLTIPEHALAHLKLWEEHGEYADFVAYQMLSGQITVSEARREAQCIGARKGGLNCKGTPKPPRSEAYKQKQREARLGRSTITPEGRKAIADTHRGNTYSLGMEPWNKGKIGVYSEEVLNLLSQAAKGNTNFKGKKHTEASNKRNSEANKGRVPWNLGKMITEEARKNLSEAHMGHVPSEETRKKMSESHRGVVAYDRMERFSLEERRLSAQKAAQARWAKKTEVVCLP